MNLQTLKRFALHWSIPHYAVLFDKIVRFKPRRKFMRRASAQTVREKSSNLP